MRREGMKVRVGRYWWGWTGDWGDYGEDDWSGY